ncbi:MAG: Bug family tripartite tricarboxylate transporter substrate binding protein [Burkholderiales bacterium]
MNKRRFLQSLPLLVAGATHATHVWAQRDGDQASTYPNRPVRIVIPFGPGSATDSIMRLLAPLLSEQLKQPFVVENVGGAGGVTGTLRVARSAPDGYTLLAASGAPITVNPYLVDKLPYDPLRDLVPITTVGDSPIVVAVNRSSSFNTLADLLSAAKAKPGALTYGSGGNGSAAHIAAEIFKWKTGTDFLHVPYKGVGPAVPDLVGGRLDALFVSYPAVRPMAEAGNVRILAVAAARRSSLVPGAPTAAEGGVNDYVLSAWNGLMAPAATPRAILDRLNTVTTQLLRNPDLVKRLAVMGMEPIPSSQDEFAARIREEFNTMGRLVKFAKIKAD